MATSVRKPQRRGIVLLIVLSLLTLFLMMGVTFLISSRQYVKGARARARHEIIGVDPRKHLDDAVYQVLRGTDMQSRLTGQSLLDDLYGRDGFKGSPVDLPGPPVISAVTPELGGQFFVIRFAPLAGFTFLNDTNYYSGRVITFYNFNTAVSVNQRPAGPISTRIVDSGVDAAGVYLRIESFEVDQPFNIAALTNSTFLINGQPFNGTGAGFNVATNNVDRVVTVSDGAGGSYQVEVALLPNFATYLSAQQANLGGADESYDAADFQNMFLALVPARGATSQDVIPSYHRPALVNYWYTWLSNTILIPNGVVLPAEQKQILDDPYGPDHIPGNADDSVAPWSSVPIVQRDFIVEMKSRFVLRPLPEHHPDFPDLDLLTGPWDVDNDNDGIPDSIWVDIGLPTVTGRNGRVVKPMVAILIKDMDGRFNVNAHGNLAQASASYTQRLLLVDDPAVPANNVSFPGASGRVRLPRGRGFGPTEVNMQHIFANATEFSNTLAARYGADGQPGVATTNDPFSAIRMRGFPSFYDGSVSGLASPPDVWGRAALALDYAGQPVYSFAVTPGSTVSQTVDDPYELDLSAVGSDTSPIDRPYTNGDLERLLRWYDGDAGALPARLLAVAPSTFDGATTSAQATRNLVTTESRHIPVPNVRLSPERRPGGAALAPALLDLYKDKMGANATFANLRGIVPLEMLRGQLFNLNRHFGDGFDNATANAMVDEPTEADGFFFNDPGFPQKTAKSPGFARHLYARNLYCLMMVLMDNGYLMRSPLEPGLTNGELNELTIRRIAQWAVNAVDFRDPDAIMTPFEYDVRPFNGWGVDGNPATDEGAVWTSDGIDNDGDTLIDEADEDERRVVWGCEFPDLVLTEGHAMHDRRAGDTKHDGNEMDTRQRGGAGNNEGDNDLDQIRKPQGSVFLEFFCPRNRPGNLAGLPGPAESNPVLPIELYDSTTGGLRLAGVPPNLRGDGLRQPVWRVVLTKPSPGNSPLDRSSSGATPGRYSTSFEPSNMNLVRAPRVLRPDRIVWFAPLSPAAGLPDADKVYYGRSGTPVLLPGQYAVVGPRSVTHIGSRVRVLPEEHLNSPHRIELGGAPGVMYYDPAGNNAAYAATPRKTPVGIVAAADLPGGWPAAWTAIGNGINLTEPLPTAPNFYPVPTFTYTGDPVPMGYDDEDPVVRDTTPETFPDRPFDDTRILDAENKLKTGWYDDYASAFLQRLANPTLPWNPQPPDPNHDPALPVNPFITVDWSTLDLTVFNGEDREPAGYPAALDPWDKGPGGIDLAPANPDTDLKFYTRQRGSRPNPHTNANPPDTRFWPAVSTDPAVTPRSGPAENHFRYSLFHSYGFLNQTMGAPINSPGGPYHGDAVGSQANPKPFPWLTWLNRPFHNPMEVMMVPASSPSRMLHEFSLSNVLNPYDPTSVFAPYEHLLNFFQTSTPLPANSAPHFYRLFDYVETPSPFVGAERFYDSALFARAANFYDTPFNYLSRFRDAGRINVNTISDEAVWEGLAKAFPAMDPSVVLVDPGPDGGWGQAGFDDNGDTVIDDPGEAMTLGTDDTSNIDPGLDGAWGNAGVDDDGAGGVDDFGEVLTPGSDDLRFVDKMSLSRQGYGTRQSHVFALNPASPSRFANPFRTAASADLMPLGGMRQLEVNSTLLRWDPIRPNKPLFVYPSGLAYGSTLRNPHFYYQGVSRLSNLLSTHSNVYAVWITVGYFEVERQVIASPSRPDGFVLGREVGLENGEANRHRGFFLIDRSIPVAFEPGVNHNVDRAVLIKRLID